MPLDQVARRYADALFHDSEEEIVEKQRTALTRIRANHGRQNTVMPWRYVDEHATVLVEHIQVLGEAKTDSLLKAYEKAGVRFDENAFNEIKSEVMEYCQGQQHNAIASIGQTIQQAFGGQQPANLYGAVAQQIASGVTSIMSRIARRLSIKRDEIILDESKVRKVYAAGLGKKWDVFVCHATEDKDAFVRPLAVLLQASGLSVWYDESTLSIGDRLRQKIDEGLTNSRYGIVVLSKSFFAKNWPQQELDGLVSKEVTGTGTKVILPVWHNISFEEVSQNSPMLAGRVAAKSCEGLETVVRQLRKAMGL